MRIMSSNEPKNTTSVFLQLFEKRNRFERFAALYIHDAETVRDIVMDSYHYMWERRESLDMGGNVEAYMYRQKRMITNPIKRNISEVI